MGSKDNSNQEWKLNSLFQVASIKIYTLRVPLKSNHSVCILLHPFAMKRSLRIWISLKMWSPLIPMGNVIPINKTAIWEGPPRISQVPSGYLALEYIRIIRQWHTI